MTQNNQHCGECTFYQDKSKEINSQCTGWTAVGTCRRYPPTGDCTIRELDWCGEWKPREPAAKPLDEIRMSLSELCKKWQEQDDKLSGPSETIIFGETNAPTKTGRYLYKSNVLSTWKEFIILMQNGVLGNLVGTEFIAIQRFTGTWIGPLSEVKE